MGLDGTIKRVDGEPLGTIAEVQQALSEVFIGLMLGWLSSGAEKIQSAADCGVIFPEFMLQHLQSVPAQYGGEYQGLDFSAQFNLGAANVVQQIDVVLYGTTTASDPMFDRLQVEHGWVTTYP